MQAFRLLVLTAVAMVFTAPHAAAQSATAPSAATRWAPWIGCWQISEESIAAGSQLLDEPDPTNARPTARNGALVCVAPSQDRAVTISTFAGDRLVSSETLVADGVERPLTDTECRGVQRAEWSTAGPQVFSRAEIACDGAPHRVVHGLSAMVAGPLWFDVQMIESEGRSSLRVRRYRRAADQRHAAPLPATDELMATPLGARLTLAEITEAGRKTPAPVLQAAVLDLGTGGYNLKAKQLIELDTAGVPESVIDLMVAMSYPKRFVVERASGGGGGGFMTMGGADEFWPFMASWPYGGMWPFYADPAFSYFYGPYYSAYYLPYGYRYWGYFDPFYFRYGYGSDFVVIDPGTGTGGGGGSVTPPEVTGPGRVVDGRGYTRIRRNEPDATPRVNSGEGGGSNTASGANSGSGNSGSSGVSSGGYSSGGASSGGDRVAIPRPPG